MTNKKSRFWTFIFSMIPGAGEMYMGFFKHGISVMALFWLIVAIATFINLGALIFLLPIIWFYSFFYVHNLKNLPDEEFYAIEDDYIFPLKNTSYSNVGADVLLKKYKKPLAIVLIVIGASILWDNLIGFIGYLLPDYLYQAFWNLTYRVPQTVIGGLILVFGIYLIIGKKKELEQENVSDNYEEPDSYMDHFGYQKDAGSFQDMADDQTQPQHPALSDHGKEEEI